MRCTAFGQFRYGAGSFGIGKVAVFRADALFEIVGIAAIEQDGVSIIGLQHGEVAASQVLPHCGGNKAQIGNEADGAGCRP